MSASGHSRHRFLHRTCLLSGLKRTDIRELSRASQEQLKLLSKSFRVRSGIKFEWTTNAQEMQRCLIQIAYYFSVLLSWSSV